MKRTDLIDILTKTARITEQDLLDARKTVTEKGGRIGDLLVKRNIITESELLEALSVQYRIPFPGPPAPR